MEVVTIEYIHIDIPDSIGEDSVDVVQKKGSDDMGQIRIDMVIFVCGPIRLDPVGRCRSVTLISIYI